MGKKNNIHKKLRDTQAPLSDQYSWENMNRGILSKLKETDNYEVVEKKSTRKFLYIFLLSLLPIIGIGGYYLGLNQYAKTIISDSSSKQKVSTLNTHNQNIQSDEFAQSTNDIDLETSSQANNQARNENTRNSFQATQANGIDLVVTKKTNIQLAANNGQTTHQASANAIVKNIEKPEIVSEIISHFVLDNPSSISINSTAAQRQTIESENHIKVVNLNPLNVYSSFFPKATFRINEARLLNHFRPIHIDQPESNERQALRLLLSLGSNIYRHNFSGGELANARNTADSYILGQSAAVTLDIPINAKWVVNTGVGIDRSVTRLDYTGVQDTMITTEVLTHNHNNVSGVTRTSTQNQDVIGTFLTQVELYNTTTSLTIPLSLQRKIMLSNYTMGIGAGVEYNYRYAKSGRYLTEPSGLSTDYQLRSHNDQDPYRSHLLNGVLSAHLDYTTVSGYGIGLGVDATYNLTNAIDEVNINSHPMRLRGSLRLFRAF